MSHFNRHPDLKIMLDEALSSQDSRDAITLVSKALNYIQKNSLTLVEINMGLATARKTLEQISGAESET
ncbi:MAG: hypothetical protein V7731_18925 [Amphritea sp.]